MTKSFLFKVKEGKLEQWKQWVSYLLDNKKSVIDTMRSEHASRELFIFFSNPSGHFVVGLNDFFDEPVPADMSLPINIEHRKNIDECLERISVGDILYDFML